MATRRSYKSATRGDRGEAFKKHEEVVHEMKSKFGSNKNFTADNPYRGTPQIGSSAEENSGSDADVCLSQDSLETKNYSSTQSGSLLNHATRHNQIMNRKPMPKAPKPRHLRASPMSTPPDTIGNNAGPYAWSGTKGSPSKANQRYLISEIGEDSWALTKFMFKLTGASYPIWKWMILFYVLWLGLSYAVATVYYYAVESLSPICSLWIIGPQIPLCTYITQRPLSSPPDVTKLETSQSELAVVMDHVGHNFDLARQMVDHEFAVRDLRIRIGASNLPRKKEVGQELEILLGAIKKGSQGTSRMTAKVGKVVDMYRAFDDYAITALETLGNQQGQPQSLSLRVLSAVGPFAAWDLATRDMVEGQVKSLFLTMTNKVGMKVKTVIDDTFTLDHDFNTIILTLERIKELVQDEFGDLPRHSILQALWESLVRPDELAELRSHGNLLSDMSQFCESASVVMKETQAALNRVNAELEEFRDGFATPGLILEQYPLKVIVGMLKSSMQALDASKQQFGQVEAGEKPAKDLHHKGTVIRTVVAKTSS